MRTGSGKKRDAAGAGRQVGNPWQGFCGEMVVVGTKVQSEEVRSRCVGVHLKDLC